MKFMFVCMGYENLSAQQLSAVLKQKGHEVDLAFDPALFDDKMYFYYPDLHKLLSDRNRVIKKIVDSKPDAIGFTVFTDNNEWACDIAKEVKKQLPDTPIIFGGIYPTTCPEVVIKNDFVDIVCEGEGEESLPELLDSMQKGKIDYKIRNLWFKKDGKIIKNPQRPPVDIEKLPYYDKELFEGHVPLDRVYLTVIGRGCLFGCSFCSQNFLRKFNKGLDKRIKSVDNVMRELKIMKEKYNYREVDFKDNILTMNKEWVIELLDRYKKEIGVPFRALSHVLCMDLEIAKALKGAGCHRVQFGIQSLNEETRRKHLLRTETNEEIEKALRACDEAGLEYSCDHMFGLPGETEEDQLLAANFYKTLKKCTRVTCFWTTFFPKTDLVAIARRRNAITDKDIEEINRAKAGYYYLEGAVKDKELKKHFRNYQMLFRLMPILPEKVVDFILRNNFHKHLYLLPQRAILLPIDLIVSFIKKDNSAFQYMNYYSLHLNKKIKRRLGFKVDK
ncbi:MAG: radical SAM protein [Nanoarchaeota archaeon]